MKKNWLNRLKLKKTTGSVRFYKPETGKNRTEPKLKKIESNQKKPSKIEPNQFESVFILKTEPNRNQSVWIGFDSGSVVFFF
jgi:hypothetical protein